MSTLYCKVLCRYNTTLVRPARTAGAAPAGYDRRLCPRPNPSSPTPPELPVSAARDEIARAIRDHQVVIVAGATGSGKTTQLPKIALELGRTRIAHTQPAPHRRPHHRRAHRRGAAGAARHHRGLQGALHRQGVGRHAHRAHDRRHPAQRDPPRPAAAPLRHDHRRRGARALPQRGLPAGLPARGSCRSAPISRSIVTSATIDPESFAEHFAEPRRHARADHRGVGSHLPGRDPLPAAGTRRALRGATNAGRRTTSTASRRRCANSTASPPATCWCSSRARPRSATPTDAVRGMYAKDAAPTEVLPLYGRLSARPSSTACSSRRRSPGSASPGHPRHQRRRDEPRRSPASGTSSTPARPRSRATATAARCSGCPSKPMSQASAQQRSGRAGRTSRRHRHPALLGGGLRRATEFTEPEILRTSLASVILQMLSLGFGDISSFPFLTPPDSARRARRRSSCSSSSAPCALSGTAARECGTASTHADRPRPRDRAAARSTRGSPAWSLEVAAHRASCASVLAIVAGLSIQDRARATARSAARRPTGCTRGSRTRPATSSRCSTCGTTCRSSSRQLGSSAFRRLCRAEYLNYVRVREWVDVATGSWRRSALRRKRRRGCPTAPTTSTRRSSSGCCSQLGLLDERDVEAGARGRCGRRSSAASRRRSAGVPSAPARTRFAIFPGSGLTKKRPHARHGRRARRDQPRCSPGPSRRSIRRGPSRWPGDLAKRRLSEPHWSKACGRGIRRTRRSRCSACEIVPKRRVQLARFDRPLARELFLRHALVEGEWDRRTSTSG